MLGLSRFPRLSVFFTIAPLAGALFGSGCTCGSGPYQGDYYDAERPNPVQNFKFVESEKGEPKVVGCADGQREGFADLKKYPRVAGCVGKWTGAKNLRDKPVAKGCGDDGSKCDSPADVCAEGWHVCGTGGKGEDLRDRMAVTDCHNAGPGRFNAAVSHSTSDEIDPCPTISQTATLPCFEAGLGAEPVCCGNDCAYGKCKDGVWKGKTKISRGTSEGCGKVTSDRNGGVMCCFDGDGDPAAAVPANAEAGEAPAGADTGGAGEKPAEEGKADTKTDAKEEGKADAKGDAKSDAKGDAKAPAKAEAKTDAKAPAKDDAKKAG